MTRAPDDLIDSMCLTWRHDFGLVRLDGDDGAFLGSGMTEKERESLRRDMRQLWEHNIAPFLQAETEALRRKLAEAEGDVSRYRWRYGNMDSPW